jgi:hypothetical protein
MLASARVAFAQSAPELVVATINALRTHRQPPRGRPANTTGRTASQIAETHGDDFLEVTGPAHLQTLITGRRPTSAGASAGEPRLSEILAQWAEDKGIQLSDPTMTYKQFGFLAARKMHAFGSELYHTGQPSGLLDDVLTPAFFEQLNARIAAGEMTAITTALTQVLR